MGQNELNDLLETVLTANSGSASGQTINYVSWRVLPLYPTLKSYVKVLFAMAGFVIWLFVTCASWPEGWIPPQWSDFTFWQKKLTSFSSDFRLYLAFPKSAVQTRQLLLGGKTICCGVLSCFIYLLMKVYGDRSNDKNPVDF